MVLFSYQKDSGIVRSDTSQTVGTTYMQMLLELQDIHWVYNLLSSFAGWILLAGFIVIPGTFTTLQESSSLGENLTKNDAEKAVLDTIQNPPLVAIAWSFLGIGAGIILFLFQKWRHNYIWLINRLFIPVSLNTIAGLVTTLINVYTAKDGYWSIMALLTVIVSGFLAAVSLIFTLVYRFWKLRLIKEDHERESKAGLCIVHPPISK
ncbi:hypothetical protein EYZ11_012327 [Aspergillus tanneri]|uniref:Uncharacterized protein n=1 Tax=Aspergillus tanneri TaxID=1220188 RepID=A0A4S3J0I7_9EURO|nr:uncharacterized protein ATNIH1004_011294 [Aspergillus tanneri]KAA8642350.1 hypothetical protein ATNIH1004_011294 [Aspergillus tanneri]THC88223.1 hypothetical protein EYZ11_012327 [Aspergillus tanneri]